MPAAVLVAKVADPSFVAAVVRAALDAAVFYVPLSSAPPAGRSTLQLWLGEQLLAALAAEPAGTARGGDEYPLRLRPLDPAHVPELERLARGVNGVPAPRPSRSFRVALPLEPPEPDAPAADGADAEDATLASRGAAPPPLTPPPPVDDEPPPDEGAGTVVFNPDAVLRDPAPETGSDSSLTLPRASVSRRAPVSDEAPPSGAARSSAVSWNVRIAPTAKHPLCGRAVAGGKYVLDSVIGEGAIGIVFKASHRDLGRTVAIKVLNPRYQDDPEVLEVFRREARAASLLEHPHVARVYDFGKEPDGLVYIVMEYLSGYTLGSVLEARRRLTPARAVDVMLQVCAALSAAHERGIVHRDVKPDNIVLVPAQDDEGEPVEIVRVCDFGIAALGQARSEIAVAAGTPEYMAPEQATGGPLTPAADVYACGVVLYAMLAGRPPFSADQAYRILMKHATEPPEPPSSLVPGLPPSLEAIVLRALEKDPKRRYQSAREMRLDLRRAAL